MSAALYAVKYHGVADSGGAVLYIGNGIITGMDVGEFKYDGSYSIPTSEKLAGTVQITASTDGTLVTGANMKAGQSIAVPFEIPGNFGNGQRLSFNVGGRDVAATFQKIRDLP